MSTALRGHGITMPAWPLRAVAMAPNRQRVWPTMRGLLQIEVDRLTLIGGDNGLKWALGSRRVLRRQHELGRGHWIAFLEAGRQISCDVDDGHVFAWLYFHFVIAIDHGSRNWPARCWEIRERTFLDRRTMERDFA